jgi:hypothetical protein
MPRICGVCLRPPREGEEMRAIRLGEDDLEFVAVSEVGLYSACSECVESQRGRVASRLDREPQQVTNHELC